MEIPDKATIIVGADQIDFNTKTNGDRLSIRGIDLDADNAATLAWLINNGEVKIIFKQNN